jgi:pyruvate/2-oxoacid:ferredoxin oxidoreductase beta subunit
MKVEIVKREWWPVYELDDITNKKHIENLLDITDDLYEQYKQVMADFEKIQDKLSGLFDDLDSAQPTDCTCEGFHDGSCRLNKE